MLKKNHFVCMAMTAVSTTLGFTANAATNEPFSLDAPSVQERLNSPQPLLLSDAAPGEKSWDDFAEGWRYRSRPGLWLAGMEGTVGKGNHKADVDASFSDLMDNLNIGLSTDFEVGKGPWSLIVFGLWQNFENDATTPGGFDGDIEADFAIVEAALAFKLIDEQFGDADGLAPRFTLEVLGGARWTYLSLEVDINEGPFADTNAERDRDWIDPYAGLRGRFDFSENFNVSVMGTAGGFGVGSDFAWSANAMFEYRFTRKIGAYVGYRAISYDYDEDGFIWDVTLHGPTLGLTLRW